MNYLFPLIAACIWGGNAIVTKMSAGLIAPTEITFCRWLLAIAILTPIVGPRAYANRRAIRRQVWRLAALGCLGLALFPSLMYLAAHFTSALDIGLIQSLMPLLSIGLSIVLLGHRLSWGVIFGGIASLAGVVVVISHGDVAALLVHGPNLGDAIMLVAAACYATYTVLLKHWQPGIPLLQSLYVQGAAATLALLPFYCLADRHGIDTANAPLVMYAGVMASIIAPLVWMHGIERIGPARASLFFNLVPIVTACLAVWLLSEQVTASLILGGAMTIGGVALAELWRTPVVRAVSRERC